MTLVRRKVFCIICLLFFATFLTGCDMFANFNSTTTTSSSTTITITSDSITTTESDVTDSSSTDMITTTEVTTDTSEEITTTTDLKTSTATETQQTTTTGSSVTTTSSSTTNQQTTTESTTTQQTTTTLEPTTTVTFTYQVTTTSVTTGQTTAEEEFLITFNSEEGSEIDPMHYTVSSSFVLPESEREYYFFRGWYLDSNYNGDAITEIIPGMTGDMVLYAKWETDYSSFILDFFGDFLVIPESCLSLEGDKEIILPEHIDSLLEAIGYLGINLDDYESISWSIDLGGLQNFGPEIFNSVIIHATFSDFLINYSNNYEFPHYSSDGYLIRYIDPIDLIEYISVDELLDFFNVFSMLGYTNLEFFLDDLYSGRFYLNINLDNIFASSIAHYAFSQVVLNLRNYYIFSIPSYDIDMNPIIITYGEGNMLTEYLSLSEIEALVEAIKLLGISEIENFSGDLYLDVLSEDNLNHILSSVVMHVSISQQIFDSGVLGDYEPESIIDSYTSDLETIKLIVKEEILRYARACVINGIHGFYYYNFNIEEMINLTLLEQQELLSSLIVRYSITPHLEELALVINYTLSADDYDDLSTDNCLTVSSILEIFEAYDEFIN